MPQSTGNEGPLGPIGPRGIQGIQGMTGIQGRVGIRGVRGIQGATGSQGIDGPAYIVVNDTGTFNITELNNDIIFEKNRINAILLNTDENNNTLKKIGDNIDGAQSTANNALPKAGGTMIGDITLGTNNIIGTGFIQGHNIPTLKSAIDGAKITADGALPKAGGTMIGDITLGTNNIIGTGFIQGHNIPTLKSAIDEAKSKTINQTAVAGLTTFTGNVKSGGLITNQLNVGTSQTPFDIFNNGSSLTKNNFNTSQSVGCIGFKDNWNTATGNNADIKQGMIYMSNVGRVIVISNLAPQYFDDATGSLINITNGLPGSGSFLFIPSLNFAYSKNATQYSTSVDGITWTIPSNLLGDMTVTGTIVYSPNLNLYVAVTQIVGFLIQTSTDGITWTNRTTTRKIFNLIYTGTRFITFGSSGCMYSTDGITWINDTIQLNNIRASIYCDTLGCILAQIQGGNRNIIKSYDSGLTWTTLTNIFPFATASNRFIWDSVSGKAYNMVDEPNNTYIFNSYLWEFDDSGNPALGGNIQMMGNTSTPTSSGLTSYIYNQSLKRFLFTRNTGSHPVFYSTTSNNLAVSGNQYVIGSLNCSGGFNPYGLANIDIMLRDAPFIGIQYVHGSELYSTLSNSLWNAMGSTQSVGSTYSITNNFTRQLCCANWSSPDPTNGEHCGYASTTTGALVSRGFNFGLSAVLGISDTVYNANNSQNFWGLWNLSTQIGLTQANQLSVQRNMICFGSNTTDANICIYTGGASSTVKQVDLGASFPANRPSGASSTDWFKFTLYWDTAKFYYKAVNTTTGVIVSGTFTALVADIPAISISLFPQCVRVKGTPTGVARLQVQRFGVYYN
jgi:hypothetical protein